MLSKPAFNALLKTLEEPPEHVKFCFATTDPQKLLVTVLSRCLQSSTQAAGRTADPRPDRHHDPRRRTHRRRRGRGAACWPRPPTAACATACRCSTRRSPTPGGKTGRSASRGDARHVDRTRGGALLEALAMTATARACSTNVEARRILRRTGRRSTRSPPPLHRIQVKQLVPEADGGCRWRHRRRRICIEAASRTGPALVPDGIEWPPRTVAGAEPARGFRDGAVAHARVPPDSNIAQTASTPAATVSAPTPVPPGRRRAAAPPPVPRSMPEPPSQRPRHRRPPRRNLRQRTAIARTRCRRLAGTGRSRQRGAATRTAQLCRAFGLRFLRRWRAAIDLAPADERSSRARDGAHARRRAGATTRRPNRKSNSELAEPAETPACATSASATRARRRPRKRFMNDPDVRRMLEQGAKVVPDSIRPLDDA